MRHSLRGAGTVLAAATLALGLAPAAGAATSGAEGAAVVSVPSSADAAAVYWKCRWPSYRNAHPWRCRPHNQGFSHHRDWNDDDNWRHGGDHDGGHWRHGDGDGGWRDRGSGDRGLPDHENGRDWNGANNGQGTDLNGANNGGMSPPQP